MSERTPDPAVEAAPRRRRDGGFTLVELTVAIVLSAVLATALGGTMMVVLRQQRTIAGRLNNARSENGIGFYVPADLASSDQPVDSNPASTACFGACPANVNVGGSNAFMLQWTSLVPNSAGTLAVTKTTKVSYRYALVGTEYQLVRVQCDLVQGVVTCKQTVVVHKLPGPPDGSTFVAGSVVPDTIIKITTPLDPSGTGSASAVAKNGQRVVVAINGGGTGAGNTGGFDTINLGASGADRSTISASSTQNAPNLVSLRSKCGGAITLVIDESASISTSDFANVKSAVADFVTGFAGTPIKLTIIPFDTYSSSLGASSPTWTKSYDMLDQTQVDALVSLVNSQLQSYVSQPYPRGGTNWEDALFRTFFNADGTVAQSLPGTVVFFTDGVPTFDRLKFKTSTVSASPPAAASGYDMSDGTKYNQQAFNRANAIAAQFRTSTRFIGVGVGSSIDDLETWQDPFPGYHYNYTHSYHYTFTHQYHYVYTRSYHYTYSHGYHYTYTHGYHYTYSHGYHYTYTHSYHFNTLNRWYHIEQGYHFPASVNRYYHLEKKVSGVWSTDTSATASTALSSTERVRFTAPYSFAKSVTATATATADQATAWTQLVSPTATNLSILLNENDPTNGDSDSTDGWTATRTYSTPYTYWEVKTDATASTAPASPSLRLNFSAPFSFSKSVTPASAPTTDGAFAWTTTTTGTNTSQFDAQDNDGSASDNTDGWTTPAKTYTTPYTYTDTDTVGSGYTASDPSWTISAKQYSSPYTAYDTDTTGATYVATDPTWSKSAKQYSAPYTAYDTDTVGSGYSATDPAWTISAKQYSSPYTAYDTNTTGSGYSASDPTWSVSAKQYSAPFTASDPSNTTGTGYSSTDPSWAKTKAYTSPFTGSDADTVGSGYTTTDPSWSRSAKQYSSPYTASDVNTDGTGYSSTDASWSVSSKQYSAPYTAYDTTTTVTHQVSSDKILSRLIADSDTGVRATTDTNGAYNNAATANMYILPQWSQFAGALRAIGLSECGGTLTLQTKLGTAPAADTFNYTKAAVVNSAGATLPPDGAVVSTGPGVPSGTFDLNVADGTYVTVEIEPANLADYTGYTTGTWTCKAAGANRTLTTVPITGSSFTGFRVKVSANEAVSCTQTVTR